MQIHHYRLVFIACAAGLAVLAGCTAPTEPSTLGEAQCDFQSQDGPAVRKLSQLPKTACQSNGDCVLIASVCGAPEAAHLKDAACQTRMNENTGMVVDCAPYEETRAFIAVCIENQCRSVLEGDAPN